MEKYAYDNELSANAILVNLAVYGGTGYTIEKIFIMSNGVLTKSYTVEREEE